MKAEKFAIHCPHCGAEIDFEKAIETFENLREACNLNCEKLFYFCQLQYDFEILEKIKQYNEELTEEIQNKNTKKDRMLSIAKKMLWLKEEEDKIQGRFDIGYQKMSLISNEIYEKLQNIEKELCLK